MPTPPPTLLASSEMLEPMVAVEPTIWLFSTRVLFMVVMSIRLPAAAPCATTSPPTVFTLAFRLDQLFCKLIWLLRIRLPSASEAVAGRASREAVRRILRVFIGDLLDIFWVGT